MTTVESRSANPLLLICNPPSSSAKQNKTKFSRLKKIYEKSKLPPPPLPVQKSIEI
jgi:hypothetical protein